MMLIVLSDAKGVIWEFVSEGYMVNAEFYKGILEQLLKRMHQVQNTQYQSSEWFLLHHNVSSYTLHLLKCFQEKKMLLCFTSLLTQKILTPADYMLFHKIKTAFKGQHFQTLTDSEYCNKGA